MVDAEKTPLQHRVLGLLAQAAREAGGGRFRYSHARLAADLGGCSLSLFPRVMRALEAHGHIRRHRLSRGYELEVIDHQEGEEVDVIDHPLGLVIDHQGALVIDHIEEGEGNVIDHPLVEQFVEGGLSQQDASNGTAPAEGGVIDHIGGLQGTHVCCVSNSSSSMARARESDLPEQPEQPPAGCPNPALWLATRRHLNAARPVADAIAAACPERSADELLMALAHARRRRHDNPEALVLSIWRCGERLREELPQAQRPAPAAPPARPGSGRTSERQPGQPESRPAIGAEQAAAERGARVARLLGPGAAFDDELELLCAFDAGLNDEQALAQLAAARAARQQPARAGRAA